ncbi:MAG: YdcF family protein, partial [Vicinamibacterales bacterium]
WAPLVLMSGGLGSLTSGMWTRPEAEVFADMALGMGVPRDALLLESRSTNTGENVELSRRLLTEKGISMRSAIAVQKPYMERRTLATFGVRWPELELVVTSPQLSFDDYTSQGISRDDVIHIMVGDLQRLSVYANKGFSTPQEIPPDVAAAYEGLVAAGYTKRLLKGE